MEKDLHALVSSRDGPGSGVEAHRSSLEHQILQSHYGTRRECAGMRRSRPAGVLWDGAFPLLVQVLFRSSSSPLGRREPTRQREILEILIMAPDHESPAGQLRDVQRQGLVQ